MYFVNIGKFRRNKHYTNNKFQYIKMHAKYEMVTRLHFNIFKGSSENIYMNYQNCQLSKNIYVLRSHYINVFVNLVKLWEKKQYQNYKSQYNKMNEQYEMVTWLISWFVAPYAFPFLFLWIIYIHNILEIICIYM